MPGNETLKTTASPRAAAAALLLCIAASGIWTLALSDVATAFEPDPSAPAWVNALEGAARWTAAAKADAWRLGATAAARALACFGAWLAARALAAPAGAAALGATAYGLSPAVTVALASGTAPAAVAALLPFAAAALLRRGAAGRGLFRRAGAAACAAATAALLLTAVLRDGPAAAARAAGVYSLATILAPASMPAAGAGAEFCSCAYLGKVALLLALSAALAGREPQSGPAAALLGGAALGMSSFLNGAFGLMLAGALVAALAAATLAGQAADAIAEHFINGRIKRFAVLAVLIWFIAADAATAMRASEVEPRPLPPAQISN